MRKSFRAALASVAVLALAGCGTTVPTSELQGNGQATGSGSAAAQGSTGEAGSTGPSGALGGSNSADSSIGGGTGGTLSSGGGTAGPVSVGGQGSASGPTSATGAVVGPSNPSTAASGLPTTGRGWDAKNVYIGIPTSDDANAAFAAAGANFDNGSTEGDANAVIADLNKSGGLFGRKVVAAYYNIPIAQFEANTTAAIQSVCSYYTQDRPVIAVISPAPQFDSSNSFHACMQHYGTSIISGSNTAYSNQDYKQLGPYLWTISSLTTDIMIPTWLSALKRQGYFNGWDTLNGSPGPTPARAGLLFPDDPQGHYVEGLVQAGLKQMGINVAPPFFYNAVGNGTDNQSEVLQFKSDGVTHVLDLPPVELEVAEFQSAAEQQHYRPRYAITSFDLPITVEQNSAVAPVAQQIGSMGIGWQPLNDTDAQHDPGPTPGQRRCLADLAAGAQTFDAAHRRAELVGESFCDALFLIQAAAVGGGGFTGPNLLKGVAVNGPKLAPAGAFGSGLSAGNEGLPGAYRDLQYKASCSCFVYVGGDQPFAP